MVNKSFPASNHFYHRNYGLSLHAILDISNKATSTSFSLLACFTGLYVVANCGFYQEKPWNLEDRFYILDNYLIFGVSYFFYDIASMYLVYMSENKIEVTGY